MAYVATLLTDEWRDGLLHECVPYRLLSDGAGALQLARNGHEGVEDVGVELQVHMIKYGQQLHALLQHVDTPFFVMAVSKRDPLAPPIALDVYVNGALFEQGMQRVGTVAGESAVVDMLTTAARNHLLVKRALPTDAPTSDGGRHVSKRQRVATYSCETTADLLDRIMANEQCSSTVGIPLFLTIANSSFVFCLKEYAFVPQAYGCYETLHLPGGGVVGDRGADKTELVKQLVTRTRGAPLGSRRSTPPFLRPLKATLLVVPTALVEQWHAALAPTCNVLVVLNKRMLHQCATFASVSACDVVIVTHIIYMTVLRKMTSKHKARVCARAPLADVAHQYCRLDWVFWKRVVIDEALHLYTAWCRRKVAPAVARGKAVWLLQGGTDVTSVDTCALLDLLLQHTNANGLWWNVSAVGLDVFLHATTVQQGHGVVVETVMTELTTAEACAYNVLQRVRTTTEELLQVAAGDLAPMMKFMHPVNTWGSATPLGVKMLSEYIDTATDAEFVWSEVDDNEDDSAVDSVTVVSVDAPTGVPPASASESELSAEVGAGEEEGVVPLRQQLDEMLDELVVDEMRERLEFFKRAAGELDRGEREVPCCSICLSCTCDCLFVCGHMLCHECVVHLFVTSKKQEMQELAEQGLVAPAEPYLAQCPQCRWSLEPHEVFWVTGVTVKNNKHQVLSQLLQRLVSADESVLVLGTVPEVLLTLFQNVAGDGIACKAMTYSPVTCRHALSWFKSGKGRVLFGYNDQLTGLKLPFVKHVVMVHPHMHGKVQQQAVDDAVLQCVAGGGREKVVHVHRLVAANTAEEATT